MGKDFEESDWLITAGEGFYLIGRERLSLSTASQNLPSYLQEALRALAPFLDPILDIISTSPPLLAVCSTALVQFDVERDNIAIMEPGIEPYVHEIFDPAFPPPSAAKSGPEPAATGNIVQCRDLKD